MHSEAFVGQNSRQHPPEEVGRSSESLGLLRSALTKATCHLSAVDPAKTYGFFDGFAQLASGLSCGLAGLAAGMAIGIVGDAGVRCAELRSSLARLLCARLL